MNHHPCQIGPYQRDFPNPANISESPPMPDWSLSKRFSKPKPYKQFTVLDILRNQLRMPAVSSHAPKADTPSPAISTFSYQAPTTLKQSSVSVMPHLCAESLPPTFKSQVDAQGELDAVHGHLSDLWNGVCAARYCCAQKGPHYQQLVRFLGKARPSDFHIQDSNTHKRFFFFKSSGLTATILKQDPSTQFFFF